MAGRDSVFTRRTLQPRLTKLVTVAAVVALARDEGGTKYTSRDAVAKFEED